MSRRTKKDVEQVAISEFKAKCLSLLDRVSKTKRPLRVTRRGKPIADVVPLTEEPSQHEWLGSMAGTADLTGDVVSPVIEVRDIEALGK
ncbi:MAG: type II toxin-antitoxin system Phd/YefM family antitoxin [Candidatus Acidiferrales bacterium]